MKVLVRVLVSNRLHWVYRSESVKQSTETPNLLAKGVVTGNQKSKLQTTDGTGQCQKVTQNYLLSLSALSIQVRNIILCGPNTETTRVHHPDFSKPKQLFMLLECGFNKVRLNQISEE